MSSARGDGTGVGRWLRRRWSGSDQPSARLKYPAAERNEVGSLIVEMLAICVASGSDGAQR
jgi:hypothetical protein